MLIEKTFKSLAFKQRYGVLQGCPSHPHFLKAFYGYYYIGKKDGTAFPIGLSLIILKLSNIVAVFDRRIHVSKLPSTTYSFTLNN